MTTFVVFVVVAVIILWILASSLVLSVLSNEKSGFSDVAGPLWFRILIVAGGPVTLGIGIIAAIIISILIYLIDDLPGQFKTVFMPNRDSKNDHS